MQKNTASQKLTLLAIDTVNNVPKTGDAGQLTAYVSIDDGSVTVLGDTSATELDATNAPGLYSFDLTQGETNGNKLIFSGKSSTTGIRLVPLLVYATPANFAAESIDSNGRVDVIKVAGTTQTARDLGTSVLLSSGTGTGQVSLSSGAVTVGTNNDKTGYGISAAAVQAIWDALTSALTTSGSIGKWILDKLDVVLSTRLATSGYTAPPSAATTAAAVWDEALAGHTTAGTAGKQLQDIATGTPPSVTAIRTEMDSNSTRLASIDGKTTNLPAAPASTTNITAGTITTVTTLTNAPNDSSGTTTLLSRVSAGRATNLDNLDAAVSAVKVYADRTVIRGTVSATAPTTTSFTCSALSPAGVAADQFKGRILVFDNATTTTALRGQATDITASSAAGLPLLTFTALTTAPVATDSFSIV